MNSDEDSAKDGQILARAEIDGLFDHHPGLGAWFLCSLLRAAAEALDLNEAKRKRAIIRVDAG